MADLSQIDKAHLSRTRSCASCSTQYSVAEFYAHSPHYFPKPHGYASGCWTNCLACWLGCGPDVTEPEGNLLNDCGAWLTPGTHLAVMPIARVTLDTPIRFPGGFIMYPAGMA